MMSLNSVARYFGQSLIITSANLSSPKRIGATTNAMRSSMKACAAGSLRSTCRSGIGIGRRVAAMALLIVLLLGRRLPADGCDPLAGVHARSGRAQRDIGGGGKNSHTDLAPPAAPNLPPLCSPVKGLA